MYKDIDRELTMWWDDTTWLPFVESEDCDITGPGHQDKAAFAEAINAWERSCDPMMSEGDGWGAGDIEHLWVIRDLDTLRNVPANTPDSIPVTALWDAR
jgi:hypothetical protein